jgi:hypothetical protein
MKAAHADNNNSRAVRTLIADDSPSMLKTLAQILALEGNFTLVGTATDGCQAVRQALTMEPALGMPRQQFLAPAVQKSSPRRRTGSWRSGDADG